MGVSFVSLYVYQETPDFLSSFMERYGKYEMLYHHYHSTYEIFFMLDGYRYSFFGSGVHRIVHGDILIFKPYVLHYNDNRESNYFKRYVMNFSDKAFSSVLDENETKRLLSCLKTGVIHLEEHEIPQFENLFKEINGSQIINGSYDRKRLAILLFNFIDMLGKRTVKHCFSTGADIVCSEEMVNTLNYINRHFMEDISLDDIIKHVHMSKSYFCKVFKKETGHTFLQYINDMRTVYAHRLLTESDMPIQKIAENAGFSSIAHFERVFKQAHGISPREMRKKTTNTLITLG